MTNHDFARELALACFPAYWGRTIEAREFRGPIVLHLRAEDLTPEPAKPGAELSWSETLVLVATHWREHITQAPWYDPDKEAAVVLILNARRRIMGHVLVTLGLLDTCLMHAREVFRPVLAVAGHSVILAHSHPSGDPTPLEADIKMTRDMIRAGQLLRIEVLDSLVIGTVTPDRPKGYASLRELGYFL